MNTRTNLTNPDMGFPQTLTVNPDPADLTDWVRRHNQAIHAFIRRGVGATNDLTRPERAVLGIIEGVETFVGSADMDPWQAEYIVGPMLTAVGNALNCELGRLDASSLWDFIAHTADRVGLDVDSLD